MIRKRSRAAFTGKRSNKKDMKKKIVYLIMAGMLTLTGCSGVGAFGDEEAQIEIVEEDKAEADDAGVSEDDTASADETASDDDVQEAETEQGDGAGDAFMPSSFVETAAGKDEFESYDEIISYLEKGQGYAYIELKGYAGELLAITETVYAENNENHSTEVSVYGKKDGMVNNFGNAFSLEKEYPIAVSDGVLYSCYTGTYDSHFINSKTYGLMVKDSIVISDDGSYIGFLRETTSSDEADTIDFTGGEKEYNEYWRNYNAATPINFTVVE